MLQRMRDPEEALLLSSGCLATDQRAKPNHADTKKALAIIAKCLFCLACLVEPGGFEPPSASTPLSVLHA